MKNKLVETNDGSHTLESPHHGVHYHSIHGAVQETRHVFIEAGLLEAAREQRRLSVLEIGFGTGLNAFMTLLAAEEHDLKVDYTTLEAFPIELETAERLNYIDLLQVPERAPLFRDLHACSWDTPQKLTASFTLTKRKMSFEDWQSAARFHLVYFDAFAPNAQPHLWEAPILQSMYQSLFSGGLLTTYCAKGAFKRTLKSIGFTVEALPGPPGKREMTRARKSR